MRQTPEPKAANKSTLFEMDFDPGTATDPTIGAVALGALGPAKGGVQNRCNDHINFTGNCAWKYTGGC